MNDAPVSAAPGLRSFTFETAHHIPAARVRPRFARITSLDQRGRRECRVPDAPAASRAMKSGTRVSHHRFAETIRHSLRDGVNAYSALFPETRLCCLRRLRMTPQT